MLETGNKTHQYRVAGLLALWHTDGNHKSMSEGSLFFQKEFSLATMKANSRKYRLCSSSSIKCSYTSFKIPNSISYIYHFFP